ncbi:MAG: hypothetical protein EBU66_01265 [Bacteroidetes bacterium]|nr:hypothetical protein [bacterium]NBP63304.1 hypothetical protein [Bacteroidota bacterium]
MSLAIAKIIDTALENKDQAILVEHFNDVYLNFMLHNVEETILHSQLTRIFEQVEPIHILQFSINVLNTEIILKLSPKLLQLFEEIIKDLYTIFIASNNNDDIEHILFQILQLTACNRSYIDFNQYLLKSEVYFTKNKSTKNMLKLLDSLHILDVLNDKELFHLVHSFRGRICNLLTEYQDAIVEYEKAGEYALQLKTYGDYAVCIESIGVTYGIIGNFSLQLHYHTLAKSIREEHQIYNLIGNSYINIGLCYMNLGEKIKAEEYYRKGLEYQIQNNHTAGIAIGKLLLSKVITDNDQKIIMLKEVLPYFFSVNDDSRIVETYIDIVETYISIQDYDQAKEYLHLSNERVNEENTNPIQGLLYKAFSTYYHASKNPYKDDKLAEIYLCKAIEIFKHLGIKDYAFQSLEDYALLLEKQERWMEHSRVYKEFHTLQQEVLNAEVQSKIQAFEILQQKGKEDHERQLQEVKYKEQEKLLHTILPAQIANRILNGQTLIAESAESVSVFFMDIVQFTDIARNLTPNELLNSLNNIFSDIDQLAIEHNIEKIKTLGDAYMAVASLPNQDSDHVENILSFALEVIDKSVDWTLGTKPFTVRIGIHVGPVVAGVIGKQRFTYDVWGDTVNIASRLEQTSEPNRIQISDIVQQLVADIPKFHCTNRGEIELKGRGKMQTFWLTKPESER